MKKAGFIALKEIRDFFQDRGDLIFSLILPVLIFALMYGAYGQQLQFNITAYVVNQDAGGQYSQQLLTQLKAHPGITLKMLNQEEADSRLERSNIQMAVVIPEDFSASLAAGRSTQIVFKQRGHGGTANQILAGMVRGEADQINREVRLLNQVKTDLDGSGASQQEIEIMLQTVSARLESEPAVKVADETLGARPDMVSQFLPGIMTMFVLFAINLTAQTLVEERRRGTLERLLTTRLTVGELFAGKFIANTARGFVQTIILMLLAWAVFNLFTPLSFLTATVVALVFSAACSTLGIILASLTRSQNQATWVAVFFSMLMVMLSGTFVEISPGNLLYSLSKLSLNTYANEAFREIITNQASLGSLSHPLLVMSGVTAAGLIISRLLFRVNQGKS
ncbi:MAG TPA: ABC transporter permease [Dehalococcoidales bacterium]|nr:ABC transporter permease [Dehalococcoidales bacterium]